MSSVIFIGGATASGKSTFAKELNKKIYNSFMYRRFQGFYDIAKLQGIKDNEIFELISSEQVDDYFVKKCKNQDYIISDVHYAVQLSKENSDRNDEKYYPTISKELVNKLIDNNISIICIYIYCSPETCMKRAKERFIENGKKLKFSDLKFAFIENNCEYYEWNNLIKDKRINGIELNSEIYNSKELVDEYLKKINGNIKSKLIKH